MYGVEILEYFCAVCQWLEFTDTHTLLIPSSVMYFQTSFDGVNAAFLCAMGSALFSRVAAACSYSKLHLIN